MDLARDDRAQASLESLLIIGGAVLVALVVGITLKDWPRQALMESILHWNTQLEAFPEIGNARGNRMVLYWISFI